MGLRGEHFAINSLNDKTGLLNCYECCFGKPVCSSARTEKGISGHPCDDFLAHELGNLLKTDNVGIERIKLFAEKIHSVYELIDAVDLDLRTNVARDYFVSIHFVSPFGNTMLDRDLRPAHLSGLGISDDGLLKELNCVSETLVGSHKAILVLDGHNLVVAYETEI